MLAKKIKFTDYKGQEREQTFHFNINETEITEMQLSQTGTLTALYERLAETQDVPRMIKETKRLIMLAYGEISEDGTRFIKSPELSVAFTQTEAYNRLFQDLFSDPKNMKDFIMGILPMNADQRKSAEQQINGMIAGPKPVN